MSIFKLKIKVEAPIGGRGGTVTKLLKNLLEKTEYFTIRKLNEEENSLDIDYYETPATMKNHLK
jgi:hypothetical protein